MPAASDNAKLMLRILKKLLIKKKIRQYQLAQILDCPPATVCRWLSTRTGISSSWLRVIESHPELEKDILEIKSEISKKGHDDEHTDDHNQ
jgi:predicted transcriptional regulator